MSRRRTVAVVATAAAVLGGAGAAAVGLDGRSGPAAAPDRPAATAEVRRETLASSVKIDGELGYGDPVPITSTATGTITWLPPAGRVVKRGGTVLRADNRPMVLLYGVLPVYRPLAPGAEGPDVAQLERNLEALGYDGFTVDDEYTSATARVVRRWQDRLGLPETGTVDATWAVVANGAMRIAELRARVGAPATGEVLAYTPAATVVTAGVDADAAGWAAAGVKVRVTLPDGREVPGTVRHVGAKAEPKQDGGKPTVPVTIALGRSPGRLREGPVEVTYRGEERRNVLTVPVAALVALAEGGYGLEVVDAAGTRYLPVRVGLFAGGRVEVSGEGLTEGLTVGMPA
ncbi:peptidoglycan-binding protein [Pseudosporangium ferrugineum]|uniref:Multidrug efflux pump subunit AcrA (Membrane-fusion protein) n=1 Tax=Pseudosporangium ferrugineum TaxID=439699 RepID=A0A2T0SFM3_9ACTN|nr:peptidoglycan-binding protein [Pseudosporangium ferrugineum]PRY32212.1 multidrug efflux pump subunit AcrA (membrane-fusion protein) [Pseudosporangium ferrugineum]